MLKTIIVLIVLTLSLGASYARDVLEETSKKPEITIEKIKENIVLKDSLKWTESLRLKDFYLHPSYLELKENLTKYKEDLEKKYKDTPSVYSLSLEYGLTLIDTGEIEKAEIVFNKAVKDFTNNPAPKIYKAWVDACNGKYVLAKDIWLPTAKEKLEFGLFNGMWMPYQVDAILGLGLIKNNLPEKDKKEVEDVLNEIIQHFSNNPKLAVLPISSDLQSGKLEDAKGKLDELLVTNSENSVLITLLGITELLKEHNSEALNLFDKSKNIYPYSPSNNLMRARALFALKNKDSDSVVEEAIKLDPVWKIANLKKKKLLPFKSYTENVKIKEEIKELKTEDLLKDNKTN